MNINISNHIITFALHYISCSYAMLFIVQFYIFELDLALSPFENMPDITSAQSCHSLSVWSAGSSDICWTFVGQPWQFGHPNIGDSGYLRMIWCALQERGKVSPCWFTTTVVLWLFWAGRGYLSNYQVIWSPPKGNHTRRIHKAWTCAYFPAVFWSELILIVILIHFVLSFLRWDIYSSG